MRFKVHTTAALALNECQVAWVQEAIAILDRLDNNVGPTALGIVSSWTSKRQPLDAESLKHAETVTRVIRQNLGRVATWLREVASDQTEARLEDVAALNSIVVDWMKEVESGEHDLRHLGWMGTRMLVKGQEGIKDLLDKLNREIAGEQNEDKKVGRPPIVYRVVKRMAEIRREHERFPGWKNLCAQINVELKCEYTPETLKSYWTDRALYLTE